MIKHFNFDVCGISQGMVWIPPGEFMMGSPEDELDRDDDEQQYRVILTRGFWLADTACTQALWQAVMGDNPSRCKGEQRPVEYVSWDDIQKFIDNLNCHGLALRFPTEAEWEYACRAGTTTPFSFGEDITPEQVNYNGDYPYRGGTKGLYRGETVPVATLPANPWGLYEMHGNVWEWCADWYGASPTGQTHSEFRVIRGGSWRDYADYCRSAYRHGNGPGYRDGNIGFRLAADEA